MLVKYLSLGLLFLTLISATSLAEGGFYGTVTFDNCDCTLAGDFVMIQPASGGPPNSCGIDCLRSGYTTAGCIPTTYPAGTYKMWIDLYAGTDSCYNVVRTVEHGDEWQEVNFKVKGPPDEPNAPGGD